MSKKPTIVLVPGAWHTPKIYNKIIPLLESHGYKCRAILLPSIQHPLNKNYDKYYAEDVATIRDCISKIIEEGEDVVLVLHSYGGLVGPDALPGLGKKERTEKGEQGGVVRLMYINAWLVPENFCPASPAGDGNPSEVPPFITMDEKNGVMIIQPEVGKRVFYNDLPDAEAEYWASQLLPHSLGAYFGVTSYAAWKHIPSTFLMGTQDQTTLSVPVLEGMIKGAQMMEPTAFDIIERCDGGHCIMIGHPEWTVSAIRRAAGEKA